MRKMRILAAGLVFVLAVLMPAGCGSPAGEEKDPAEPGYTIREVPLSVQEGWSIPYMEIAANDDTVFYICSPHHAEYLGTGPVEIRAMNPASSQTNTVYSCESENDFLIKELTAVSDRLFWVRLDAKEKTLSVEEMDFLTGEVRTVAAFDDSIFDICLETDGKYLTWMVLPYGEGALAQAYDISEREILDVAETEINFFNPRVHVNDGICAFSKKDGDRSVIQAYDIAKGNTLYRIPLQPGMTPLDMTADTAHCVCQHIIDKEYSGKLFVYDSDTKSEQAINDNEEFNIFSWDYRNGRLFINDRNSDSIVVMDPDSMEKVFLPYPNGQLLELVGPTGDGYLCIGSDPVIEDESGAPLADTHPTLYYISVPEN